MILLAGCGHIQASRFHSLDLKMGMKRADIEKQVDALLGQPRKYSPYGNSLRGGIVLYHDGGWILEVNYKAGVPAPWFENKDGKMEHYPPVDETLLEYKIKKNP